MQLNIVLLAGGVGSRLWPLSNNSHPKQFLKLPGQNLSCFQSSLERGLQITSAQNIIIVTKNEYKSLIFSQISELALNANDFHFIFEECSNNTGIAVYYACSLLMQKDNYNYTYFLPTDHLISEDMNFFSNILNGVDATKINVFGQRAFNPCSSFGYIVAGQNLGFNYYKAEYFVEKPDYDRTISLKNSILMGYAKVYKNLGIYLASSKILYDEFHYLHNNLPSIIFDKNTNEHRIRSIYDNVPIDKMIAERSSILNLIEIGFDWQDIGSIESLYQSCPNNIALFDCVATPEDIAIFNYNNSEFELCSNNGKLQIVKRLQ